MTWIAHVISGALEAAWCSALKLADVFTRMGWIAVVLPAITAGRWPAR